MLVKFFATPVALCMLGCIIGVAAITSTALRPHGCVLLQAINTGAPNLGSTAIAESGGLTIADTIPIVATSLGIAAVIVVLT